jgi:hypothetical protein
MELAYSVLSLRACGMNKYTFNLQITPRVDVEYAFSIPPFDATVRETTLALLATADAANDERLGKQADDIAHNLARSLSYELADKFNVEFQSRHVLRDTGQQSISTTIRVTILPADLEEHKAAEKRGRQRQSRIVDLARREIIDPDARYVAALV